MSDIAQVRNTAAETGVAIFPGDEVTRYAWLTVMFFFAVFGGLTSILVAAHYITGLMS